MEDYVSCVLKEIKIQGEKYCKSHKVSSIYIGGGTPSVLKDGMIGRILTQIKNSFKLLQDCEISVEVNPNSVTEKKLREYKLAGVNRLSIGAQTINDNILKLLARQHNAKDTKTAIKLAKKMGFENINVDMMLALPSQKLKDVKKMAKFLIKQKIQHISPYSLILEEGTPLYKLVKQGKVTLPTEDEAVEMYNCTYNILNKNGFKRYEVSNFSIPDYESKHNLNYWQMGEYLACGLAGHSFIDNVRFANADSLVNYITSLKQDKIPVTFQEKTTLMQRKEEAIMLFLRTRDGIDIKEFDNKFGGHLMTDKKKEIEFLTKHNLVSVKSGFLRVNDNAYYVLNSIIAKLV